MARSPIKKYSGTKVYVNYYVIQEKNPSLSIGGSTTILPAIQTEYCDHEVYYCVRHFTIFGIAGILTPDHPLKFICRVLLPSHMDVAGLSIFIVFVKPKEIAINIK